MDLCTGIRRSQYSVLPDKDSGSTPNRNWGLFTGPLRLPKSTLVVLSILLTTAISGISGFLAGKRLSLGGSDKLIQRKPFFVFVSIKMDVDCGIVNRIPVTFDYEFNYAEAPSNVTNQRWESLFPLNGGFFEHPTVGPDPVAFSVFHQLHCLVRYPKSVINMERVRELALSGLR